MDEKLKALKAAFPGTIPVMTGFLFLGMAFGIMLEAKGYGFFRCLLMSGCIYAVIGLLVVYCLKNTEVFTGSHGIPEIIATVFILVVHRIKKNVLLSIAGGTLLYMALVQYIFI